MRAGPVKRGGVNTRLTRHGRIKESKKKKGRRRKRREAKKKTKHCAALAQGTGWSEEKANFQGQGKWSRTPANDVHDGREKEIEMTRQATDGRPDDAGKKT